MTKLTALSLRQSGRRCSGGGLMGSEFSVKRALGVFTLANYVNQVRTAPAQQKCDKIPDIVSPHAGHLSL